MRRPSAPMVFALISVSLLLSLNCMAASALFPPTPTPTYTPTQTPTATPPPTPTFTPTVTLTATPDISSAQLELSDLPPGFRPLSFPTDADPNLKWFAYGDSSPFQVILGAVEPLGPDDQFDFDALIENPDLLLQSINASAGTAAIKSLKPISGLDQFGDASNGFTGLTTSHGITLNADLFLMRKGRVGVFVISMYPRGAGSCHHYS